MRITPEQLDELWRLTTQLYAANMVSSSEDFWQWPPEIRVAYFWLVTDISREVRDTVRKIGDARQAA